MAWMLAMMAFGCAEQAPAPLPVTLGISAQPTSALFHIAKAQGFFADVGLDITMHQYPTGKRTLSEGLMTQRDEYISVTEIPFVANSFEHPDLVILASLFTTDNVNRIVARSDHGITELEDLRGKTIGIRPMSAVHFFLFALLQDQEIPREAVTLRAYRADELVPALVAGEIDAFSMREPYASQAKERLGDRAVVLEAPGVMDQNELLVSKRGTVERNPAIARRLIRAARLAARYADEHPEESLAIVAEAIDSTYEEVADSWPSYILKVSLYQSLLLSLEDSALWMIEEGIVGANTIPNFLDHILVDPISAVAPDHVTLIH